MEDFSLTAPGRFVVGCNYWASHAGTAMWSDWQPRIVDADFNKLARAGLQVLRVFPLWPDFQPIHLLRGFGGMSVEYRFGEQPLPDTPAGRAGVSEEMLARFEVLADLAHKHGLKLIVGLVTGWMSGRLFVPPALEGLNVVTDPTAVLWQCRFVDVFVRRLAGKPAIAAWDLGNECNCLATNVSRGQAWVWTHAITSTVRAADASRPVVSGMHGLWGEAWSVVDQAELTDLLTTHPYPVFTPGCDQDPADTIRTCTHSSAETLAYANLGGKPCLVEETGSLGPMYAGAKASAGFIRTQLFSAWAHDGHGLLWWCGFEQSHLEHAPYDWCGIERELGLFDAAGKPKPVLRELTKFRRLVDGLPFAALPPRITEAVCILSQDQDRWLVAHSAFILSKQAGLEIEYQSHDQPLKDAAVYLLPCVNGNNVLPRRQWLALLDRVRAGATLYISYNGGMLSPFTEVVGAECITRQRRPAPSRVTMTALEGEPALTAGGTFSLTLQAHAAQVLGRDEDGNAAFIVNRYGKGRVMFLDFPMELQLASTPGAFHLPDSQPYWRVYRHVAQAIARSARVASKTSPMVGLTEHALSKNQRVVIAVNYSPSPEEEKLTLAKPWRLAKSLHGAEPQAADGAIALTIPENDAAVLMIARS